MAVKGLECFLDMSGLPETAEELSACLRYSKVEEVRMFVLGPVGTNINQAAHRWAMRMGITDKVIYQLRASSDGSDPVMPYAREARQVQIPGVLPMFWTCAVYFDLNKLFFLNPDTGPLYVSEIMNLDSMRLCVRPDMASEIVDGVIPTTWRIAAHPSPTPLLSNLPNRVLRSGSNASAAKSCAAGEVQACVTTESGQDISGLAAVHVFGSPPMVFFGGITVFGRDLLREIYKDLRG